MSPAKVFRKRGSALRVLGVLAPALGAATLAFASAAQAARTLNLSLYISFYSNGTVSVTAPDGSPIGTTSGSPTVIPAGYYSLVFSGPGGCFTLPTFHLSGPGANIISNMTEAQGQKNPSGVELLPSSTYVWSNDSAPGVVHTFVTSAQVEGSPPTPGTSDGTSSRAGGSTSRRTTSSAPRSSRPGAR